MAVKTYTVASGQDGNFGALVDGVDQTAASRTDGWTVGKALHNLAVLYAEGIDGKPNYETAARWFRKASDYGIADSQYNLAVLYARGIGVEQNPVEAYRWFAVSTLAMTWNVFSGRPT